MAIYQIMTNKTKSSTVKKVVVECKLKDSVDIKEYDIDSEIFDDIQIEAATRFVEQHIKEKKSKIAPTLTVFEKKHEKNVDKYVSCNSYHMIVFAGFHKKAEIMRKNFLSACGVDLKTQGIKSDGRLN